MDGVGTPIIGRPRPLPGHDTPNPANNTYTLNYEEPPNSQRSSPSGRNAEPAEVAVPSHPGAAVPSRVRMLMLVTPGVCASNLRMSSGKVPFDSSVAAHRSRSHHETNSGLLSMKAPYTGVPSTGPIGSGRVSVGRSEVCACRC